ncbi:MAG: hypothetical protein ABW217_10935 [Polyangiaceae bacterium]
MLHTFRQDRHFQARIQSELLTLKEQLDPGHLATVEVKVPDLGERDFVRGGSKPLLKVRDGEGRVYLFKQCDPALAAAEEAAYELRRLGGRPSVPARRASMCIDGLEAHGLLKPYAEFDNERQLEPDTTQWSEEQRAVMLLEHAWEWFLDNLDTNTSQYGLMGPLELPVNVDWDRSFFSAAQSELSRFAKYRATLPNARTFLYADYVAGKTKLPLWLLSQEARRIRRLPKARVRAILERYAAVCFDDPAQREHFVTRVLRRRHGIEREVATFMRELWAERRSLETPPDGLRELVNRQLLLRWADWQLVLNSAMRGPVGSLARRVLSFTRGLRAPVTPVTPAPDAVDEDRARPAA